MKTRLHPQPGRSVLSSNPLFAVEAPISASRLILLLTVFVPLYPMGRAQPVPHHFEAIAVQPDRTVTLSLGGSISNIFNLSDIISNQFIRMFDLYGVETSSNLSDWTPLAWLLRTNNDPNPLVFHDPNAAGPERRFYRTFTNHLLTAFPKPSGRYAVGSLERVMIDPTRTNLYRYTPKTNAFMVTFWYPADPSPAGTLPASMWDRCLAADMSLYIWGGADTRSASNWASICSKLVGHRFRDVRLATGTNRFPVVLYSHGLPAWRKLVSRTAEELASHGYVVAIPDHPDCWATEFPDGRYLTGNHGGDVSGRLKDMKFLVDQLVTIEGTDPTFGGRLDLDRIGVYGGSMGGMVVETCRTNSRVKCALLYDPTNVQLNSAGLQKPFLVALGQNNLFYSQAQWLFSKATTDAILLQIRGADHSTPCDMGWLFQIPWGRRPAQVFDDCAIWFFDTYLKGETLPFPSHPEIYNVQRK